MAGRLLANKVAVKSCKLASPKRCKKACVLAKRNRPSSPANSSTEFDRLASGAVQVLPKIAHT
ncbi:MAG: hypothetical protein WCC08_03150, partial [Terrimicrobiaceae bacterium]